MFSTGPLIHQEFGLHILIRIKPICVHLNSRTYPWRHASDQNTRKRWPIRNASWTNSEETPAPQLRHSPQFQTKRKQESKDTKDGVPGCLCCYNQHFRVPFLCMRCRKIKRITQISLDLPTFPPPPQCATFKVGKISDFSWQTEHKRSEGQYFAVPSSVVLKQATFYSSPHV